MQTAEKQQMKYLKDYKKPDFKIDSINLVFDLDEENTEKVLSVLQTAAHQQHKAILIVTHETEALKIADRVFRMNKGEIVPA